MRIQIWNAFASNNSGSYVIVGRFPKADLASEVATELLEVAKAQSAWNKSARTEPSPLTAYAARHGIPNVTVGDDEWPEYSAMPHPAVWAVGHQVFVYTDQTVTMPTAIGHLMYARGGRVETELDHTHHAIVAVFEIHFHWKVRKSIDVPARVQDLVDALWADKGALMSLASSDHPPAWRGALPGVERPFGEPDLVVGAAFDDLQAGFTSIARACKDVGADLHVRLSEGPAEGDPFAFLRPTAPAPRDT